MEFFFQTITKLSSSRHEEDIVDRLNFRVTPLFLVTAALILSYKVGRLRTVSMTSIVAFC